MYICSICFICVPSSKFMLFISLFLITFFLITYNRFSYGLFLFFLLLPTYLLRFTIGPFPTTLLEGMFGIITFVWLIHIFQKKVSIKQDIKKIIEQRSLLIATSLFILSATISIFTSIDTRAALGLWKAFYIEPIILAFILYTTIKEKKDLHLILLGLILCGLGTSILAIYQHFTGWLVPHAFWANRDTYRVTGWYGFPNAVGLFLAPIIPLALFVIASEAKQSHFTKKISIIASVLFVPLSLLAIFFAKSTGAIIGVAAAAGVLLLLYKKTRIPVLILGIIAFSGLFFLPANNPIRQEILMQDRSGQLRLDMWAETTQYLSEHPITGAGLASYHRVIYPYRIDKRIEVFHHPHNIFLTMWVNLGLVGLVGFVWIIIWFYRVAFQQITKHSLTPYLIAAMTTFVVMGLVDSPYIKNDLAMMFWVLPALLLISTSKHSK